MQRLVIIYLKITQKSAWYLTMRIRETWQDTQAIGIESFWALLKRGYHGTHHHISVKHLGRYVNEFAGRHNTRQEKTIDQMEKITRCMSGKRLTYKKLVG